MPAKAGIQSKRTLCGLDSSFRWNDEQWNLGFPLSAGRFIVWRGEAKQLRLTHQLHRRIFTKLGSASDLSHRIRNLYRQGVMGCSRDRRSRLHWSSIPAAFPLYSSHFPLVNGGKCFWGERNGRAQPVLGGMNKKAAGIPAAFVCQSIRFSYGYSYGSCCPSWSAPVWMLSPLACERGRRCAACAG